MGRTAKDKRPRALGGGRSARYESRREARNADRAYAPGWSDAAAAVVLEQLHAGSIMCGQKIVRNYQPICSKCTFREPTLLDYEPTLLD